MTKLRTIVDQQLEAQRWQASQASREQAGAWEAALERAGELALLGRLVESRRVLEIARRAA